MKADRSVCKSEQSSTDVTWQKMTQSSANKWQGESSSVEMSLIYTKKKPQSSHMYIPITTWTNVQEVQIIIPLSVMWLVLLYPSCVVDAQKLHCR